MRLKVWALAAMAALATALPARADVFYEYVQVAAITSAASGGPAITSLNMNVGDIVFIQVALRENPVSPSVFVPGVTSGLFGAGIRLNYAPGIVINPSPANTTNLRLVDASTYTLFATNLGAGATFATAGLNFGADPGSVPDISIGNRIALFNLRITAVAATAGTALTITDPGAGLDVGLYQDADPSTPLPIDAIVFTPAHLAGPHTLNVTVAGIPEPSSMVLAGLALSGLGYRLRRKKVAVAAAV